MNWITDLDGALEHSGDLPQLHSLPHTTTRQADFAAAARGPNGETATVRPSFFKRVKEMFKPSNDDEVERLKKLIAEAAKK